MIAWKAGKAITAGAEQNLSLSLLPFQAAISMLSDALERRSLSVGPRLDHSAFC